MKNRLPGIEKDVVKGVEILDKLPSEYKIDPIEIGRYNFDFGIRDENNRSLVFGKVVSYPKTPSSISIYDICHVVNQNLPGKLLRYLNDEGFSQTYKNQFVKSLGGKQK